MVSLILIHLWWCTTLIQALIVAIKRWYRLLICRAICWISILLTSWAHWCLIKRLTCGMTHTFWVSVYLWALWRLTPVSVVCATTDSSFLVAWLILIFVGIQLSNLLLRRFSYLGTFRLSLNSSCIAKASSIFWQTRMRYLLSLRIWILVAII